MTTRGRGQTRECPVELAATPCGKRVAPGRIMCTGCWKRVPADKRLAVAVAWGRWHETMNDDEWNLFVDARALALGAAATT